MLRTFASFRKTLYCVWLLSMVAVNGCATGSSSRKVSDVPRPDIPPTTARDMMHDDASVVYLDVRTVEEFEAGHPAGAWNIPFLFRRENGQWESNASFVQLVRKTFDASTPIVVGCRTGGRSAKATKLLNESGFRRVQNMDGGFAGRNASDGSAACKGWEQLGFPISAGSGGSRSFAAISGGS